jgi:hypothetical protein
LRRRKRCGDAANYNNNDQYNEVDENDENEEDEDNDELMRMFEEVHGKVVYGPCSSPMSTGAIDHDERLRRMMRIIEDDDETIDDEDNAVQLFYCRYHPLGKFPIIMSILDSITFVIIAFESCDLLRISVHSSTLYDAVNASKNYGLMNATFGLKHQPIYA